MRVSRALFSGKTHTTKLNIHFGPHNGPTPSEALPMYRVMDKKGKLLEKGEDPNLGKEKTLSLYRQIISLNVMDHVLYEVQRQGRISFYMTAFGEEAALFGSASALEPTDWVYSQYREAGLLMYRGFTFDDFMNQCHSNEKDLGKGRQMPVHYGGQDFYVQTISSPLTTQLPQAAGTGYALKMAKSKQIACCYFGEGAASEGDFHAALNFAATLGSPTLFFCRNNGYAISTPTRDQYAGDGIASRGLGYGIRTIRVDGNDIWAVHNATKRARELIVEHQEPVIVEAMTYRVGHHSTSDDSSIYREFEEVDAHVKEDNPIDRLKGYMKDRGWWSDEENKQLHKDIRKEILQALRRAEKLKKPPISDMFSDVYDEMPAHLKRQQQEMIEHVHKRSQEYNLKSYAAEKKQ